MDINTLIKDIKKEFKELPVQIISPDGDEAYTDSIANIANFKEYEAFLEETIKKVYEEARKETADEILKEFRRVVDSQDYEWDKGEGAWNGYVKSLSSSTGGKDE